MRQRKADPIEHQSSHPLHERIEKLKQLFPEAVNEDGLDVDTLVNLLGKREERRERYNFTWAGKQEAILSLNKRSQAALKPIPDESLNWHRTGHLFIEGDNLEALKLLYKSYFGRVKMIYIDPPYNTGKDFVYPDNHTEPLANYLRLTGQVDEEGNVQTSNIEASGRRHSNWLSMMYPRLFLARQLLRDDGVIFVSIDDNEVHNLRMLMNLIFGEENFRNEISIRRYDKNISNQFADNGMKSLAVGFERVLVYAKSSVGLFNPIYRPATDSRQKFGYWKGFHNSANRPTMRYELLGVKPRRGQWKWQKAVALEAVRNYEEYQESHSEISLEEHWEHTGKTKRFIRRRHELTAGQNKGVEHWIPPSEGILLSSNWIDIIASERSLRSLGIDFDAPKSITFIKRLIAMGSSRSNSDIILDFFAGSATTAQAVLEQNREDGGKRKFIMVQLPEPMSHETFDNIADVGKERIRRVIQRMSSESASQFNGLRQPNEDLGFRVFRLDKSSMRQWQDLPSETSADDYDKQMALFIADPLLDGWTIPDVIAEVAVKEVGFSLTYRVERVQAVAEQTVWQVIDDEKEQHFYICLDDRVSFDALKPLRLTPDVLFVFRDSAIDDTIVANLALACRIKSI